MLNSFLLCPQTTRLLYFQEDSFGKFGHCFQVVRVQGHHLRCILTVSCRWAGPIAQKIKMKRKKPTEDLNARKEIWRSMFESYVPPAHGDLGFVSYYPTPKLLTSLNLRHRPRLWTTDPQCLNQNSMCQSLQLPTCPVTHRP